MLNSFLGFDRWLRHWVVIHRIEPLTPVMLGMSLAGRRGIIWLAVGVTLTVAGRMRPTGLVQLVLAILLAATLTDQVLKPLLGRDRPFVSEPEIAVVGSRPKDASLPSGHTANAFAGAFVLARTMPSARVVWWTLAVAIAYSRIYLGVHYPLDVVVGAVVGLLCGLGAQQITARLTNIRKR